MIRISACLPNSACTPGGGGGKEGELLQNSSDCHPRPMSTSFNDDETATGAEILRALFCARASFGEGLKITLLVDELLVAGDSHYTVWVYVTCRWEICYLYSPRKFRVSRKVKCE